MKTRIRRNATCSSIEIRSEIKPSVIWNEVDGKNAYFNGHFKIYLVFLSTELSYKGQIQKNYFHAICCR